MRKDSVDDPRRVFLIRALAAGLYAAGMGLSGRGAAELLGKRPERLQPGRSLYRVEGDVRVNGQQADLGTRIGVNDQVETGPGAQAIFVVGQDAFLLRGNSQLQLSGKAKFAQRLKQQQAETAPVDYSRRPAAAGQSEAVVEAFRLITGGVLTVFGKTGHQASTSTASVGIRGTGVYFESEPDRSYVCTCYGTTDISALDDSRSQTQVFSKHHDAPKYILKGGPEGQRIIKAPFKNHNDLELMLLEELVGRTPPFSVASDSYGPPRRGY